MQATILLVEDHEMLRRMLREWLGAELPGCRFVEAISGVQAVEIARGAAPDLVLMDIVLPGINGLEATRRIKAVAPDLPVVVLTGYQDAIVAARAEAAGACALVAKRDLCSVLAPVLKAQLALVEQRAHVLAGQDPTA